MGNKGKLFRMMIWGGKSSIKEGVPRVMLGVVACICLDTWNQIPFLWNSQTEIGVIYYWFNSFSYGGFYSPYILPMLSCIPYATSFCDEYISNMLPVLVSKSNVKQYCVAKLIITALSGGFALAVGGSFFVFLASKFTVLVSKSTLPEYQGLPYYQFMEKRNGIAYFMIMIFLLFLSGILWSSLGLWISTYICNRYVVYVAPFIGAFFLVRLNVILNIPSYFRLDLLLSGRSGLITDRMTLFFITIIVLLIVTMLGILFYKRVKKVAKNEQFV